MRDGFVGRGLVNAALVLVGGIIVVLLNLIAITATDKFALKIDLTANKLYELSELTSNVASALESPVEITAFSREADYPVMLREILARYAGLSPKIAVEYRDPYENPMLVDAYRQKGYSIAENDIIVNGQNNIRQLKLEDLYVFNPAKTRVKALRAEQALTGALLYTASGELLLAEFSDGHGERPSAELMRLFQENNFTVKRVTLGVSGVAEATDIMVIASPERDFQPEEIEWLEGYLNTGGKLLVFMEPAQKRLENFEKFLARWGIEFTRQLVFEEKAYLSNNPVNIVPMYAPHPINQFFGDKRYFLVSPATRALQKSAETTYELDVMPVLTSSPGSYAKEGKDFTSSARSTEDRTGPFILALSSWREVATDGKEAEAKILALGSRKFYDDDILGKSSYANADFLVQAVNWLVANADGVRIPPKNVTADPINVLPDTVWFVGVLFIGVIPLLVLFTGVIVCVRRKRL